MSIVRSAELLTSCSEQRGTSGMVDLDHSSQNDISILSARNCVLRKLDSFDAIGIDLPCNTWSKAGHAPRHSRMPGPLRGDLLQDIFGLPGLFEKDSLKVQSANCMYYGAIEVIRKYPRFKLPGYLENPLTPRLWKTPGIPKLLQSPHVQLLKADQRQYGVAWRKPTAIL